MKLKTLRTRKKYRWEELDNDIFEMMYRGMRFQRIAQEVSIPYPTIYDRYRNNKDIRAKYTEYCRKKEGAVVVSGIQKNFMAACKEFKEKLNIGDRVKNHFTGECGVVIEKYKHIFTIRVDPVGYSSSFMYLDYKAFVNAKERKKYEHENL